MKNVDYLGLAEKLTFDSLPDCCAGLDLAPQVHGLAMSG